jgi:hypothetical protein
MSNQLSEDQYPKQEAKRRAEAMIRAALNMPPKPHKAVAGKGRVSNRKTEAAGVPQLAEGKEQS